MQQKKTDPVVLGVLGCLVAFFAVFAAAVVVVIVWARPRAAGSPPGPGSAAPAGTFTSSSADSAPMAPPRRPWEPISAEPCAGVPGTTNELAEPLRVHDPARVDLAELYDQARALVLRLEPNARLIAISALKEAKDGTFDSADGNISFNFEYRCLRAGAAPGQDLYQGMLLVFAQGGTVRASRLPVSEAPLLAYRGDLAEPPCSTVAAWSTAVASGVPAAARATFVYMAATGGGAGASWLITVPGHPFRREVDGETCRLRPHSSIHPISPTPVRRCPISTHGAARRAGGPRGARGGTGGRAAPRRLRRSRMGARDRGRRHVGSRCRAVFAQVRVVAEKLQPGAQFTGITAFETTHGKADLTGDRRVLYKFEIVARDPAQPPGKDTIERGIDVTAQRRQLHGVVRDWPASQLKSFGGAMEPPLCTRAQALEVAVKSGVPDNAVTTLLYYDNTPFAAGGPWVWSVRVEGHDEHRREIDGKACAMIRSWGAKQSRVKF